MSLFKKKLISNKITLNKFALVGKNIKIIDKVTINNKNKNQIKIGNNVTMINPNLFCFDRGFIKIGDYTYIGKNSQIDACKSVVIGKYCMISNNVMIQDHNSHPIKKLDRRKQLVNLQKKPTNVYESLVKKINIGDDVWIGAEVTILKGVKIGSGSIIATKTVVTKNVPTNSIFAGNPGKIVKKINQK